MGPACDGTSDPRSTRRDQRGGRTGARNTFEAVPGITFTRRVKRPTLGFFRGTSTTTHLRLPDRRGGTTSEMDATTTSVTKQFYGRLLRQVSVSRVDGVSYEGSQSHGDNGLLPETASSSSSGSGTFTFATIKAKRTVKARARPLPLTPTTLFETAIYSGSGTPLGKCTAGHVTFPGNCARSRRQWTSSSARSTCSGSVRSRTEPVQRAVGLGQGPTYMGLYYCFSSTLCTRNTFLQRRIHADDGPSSGPER